MKLKLLAHPLVLCAGCFSSFFLVGLLLFFPLEPWARQLEQLAQDQEIELKIEDPRLRFPPALTLSRVRIGIRDFPSAPPLQLDSILIRPLWSSLVGDNPGITFFGRDSSGTINGRYFRNGELTLMVSNFGINAPLSRTIGLRGLLSKGHFSGVIPLSAGETSLMEFQLRDLELSGFTTIGSRRDQLILSELSCQATATGPVVTLKELTAQGPDLALTAGGHLRLGPTVEKSFADLNVTIKPRADLDPFLLELLQLASPRGKDGDFNLRLKGALSTISGGLL